MTFPTGRPPEDEDPNSSGAPVRSTSWELRRDLDAEPLAEDAYDEQIDGAFADEPQPAPAPRSANLGSNLFLILSGIAFVVLGLLVSSGDFLAFGGRPIVAYGMFVFGGFQVVMGMVSGFRGIQQSDSPGQEWRRVGRAGIELVQTLGLAILIFLAVRAMAQNFRVEGASMEPGLHNGQYLLVNKAVYFKLDLETLDKYLPFIDPGDNPERFIFHAPKRGEVIVFEYPEDRSRDFIKRVIGVPGDTVKIEDGQVYVKPAGAAGFTQIEDDYINGNTTRCPSSDQSCEWVVPEKNYFVLGDNRGNSSDSRNWRFVPEDHIIGRAMFTYWPDLGGVGNRSIDLGILRLPLP